MADQGTMSKKQIADALERLSTHEIHELLESRKQKKIEALLKEREELQSKLGENTRELQALGHPVIGTRSPGPRRGAPAAMNGAGGGGSGMGAAGGGTTRSRMQADDYEEHVITCLRRSDDREASVSDIREYVQERGGSPNTLQQSILPSLVKAGKIESPKRGVYRLPGEE